MPLTTPFAPTTGNNVETLIDTKLVQPRLLADLQGARNSIRVVQYNVETCKLGLQMAEILMEKARAGVEAQVALSRWGDRIGIESRRLCREMAAAGVKVVATEVPSPCLQDPKVIIVDSRIAYADMHDIIFRFTGEWVKQLEARSALSFQFYQGSMSVQATPMELGNEMFLGAIEELSKAGVDIFHYPTLLRAKVLLCDNKEAAVGSINEVMVKLKVFRHALDMICGRIYHWLHA